MSSKYIPPPMKASMQKVPEGIKSSAVTKWLPFICAGAAVGVSILALKELKKIKSEMVVVKNQQPIVKSDPTLNLKMDQLEDQLKKINEYLMNNNPKNPKIIRNAVPDLLKEVKIINESDEKFENVNVENVEDNNEYEEIEVTDDDEDN